MAGYGDKEGNSVHWMVVYSVNRGGSQEKRSPRLEDNLNQHCGSEFLPLSHLWATGLGFVANLILPFFF